MHTRRISLLGTATATVGALLLGGTLSAQAQTPRTVYLFNAALGKGPSGINAAKNGPWGNGVVANARDVDFEGAQVLRLTTRNFQEGVRFDITTPVDLTGYQSDGFVRLRLRFRDSVGAARGEGGPRFPGAEGGFPGGGGGFGGGGRRRGENNGDFLIRPRWDGNAQFGGALPPLGGGDTPFNPGNPEGGGVPEVVIPPQETNITELNLTMLRETGATVGRIPIDLDKTQADEDGWRLFVLPIKEMTSTPNAAGPVKRILVTSDKEDTFYMAQAAIVVETGQMTVSLRRPTDTAGAQIAEIEVKPGALNLIADVEAGAADPQVEWNFDADNVGNLPPGAISNPTPAAGAEGGMTEGGVMPGQPGMGQPRIGVRPGLPGGARPTAPLTPTTPAAPTGVRIDALGLTATFEYPNEEQNYRVEVTVRDRSGQKQPVTASLLIRVRA